MLLTALATWWGWLPYTGFLLLAVVVLLVVAAFADRRRGREIGSDRSRVPGLSPEDRPRGPERPE